MEVGDAKKRCGDVIERIERLPKMKMKMSGCCNWKRTLVKLVESEVAFLSRFSASVIGSSNIGHMEAVVHILELPSITGVSRVCKTTAGVHVDIVCTLNTHPVWIIVSHRNPNYVTWNHLQSRIHQLTAAARSALALMPSSLILFFSRGLSSTLSDNLIHEFGATRIQLGHPHFRFLEEEAADWINVLVPPEASVFQINIDHTESQSHLPIPIPMPANWDLDLLEDPTPFSCLISKINTEQDSDLVNFGTTALIALVSAISNGVTDKLLATPETELRQRFKGNYEFVIGQVMSEIQNPILAELSCSISGKRGIICETVHSEFKELVLMFGGPNEKLRAIHLLKYLTVVPDGPSKRMMSLPTTRKMDLKNKIVFGTGDHWCAPTLTANMAFVRAVSQAGMSLFTIEHRPRALTGD